MSRQERLTVWLVSLALTLLGGLSVGFWLGVTFTLANGSP